MLSMETGQKKYINVGRFKILIIQNKKYINTVIKQSKVRGGTKWPGAFENLFDNSTNITSLTI